MAARPPLPAKSRHVLDIARTDRGAATRVLAELPLAEQVALVCETPVTRRGEILGLVPFPEQVVPEMPEAELCFTVRAIGLSDAGWLLEYATPEQVVACIDLDGWDGLEPDRASIDAWFDALVETSSKVFMRSLDAIDAELLVIHLKHKIRVAQMPDEKEGWDPPEGAQTLDGQFYITAVGDDDDLAATITMLRRLFQHDYWTYFRMLQAVNWELDSDNGEFALRWRTGRLQDLGFPPWDEAMSIYRFLGEAERAALPPGQRPLDVTEWHLPVWIPNLPAAADSRHLIFRTIPELEDSERRSAFYAFVAVANQVAVADGLKLSDAEFAPRAIDKAADFISVGLSFMAGTHGLPAVEVLRRVTMQHLFRLGANLEPERARP
jgi:hypothetical protein